MIALAVLLGTAGYGLVYYGAKLWAGDPETLAYAFGFAKTNNIKASSSSGSSGGTPSRAAPGAAGGATTPSTNPVQRGAAQGRVR